ncbi:MAG: DUF4358 domain-containing protein [Clostridia bacterium]|nr:DUF4358 domain-containing protein [Clostridia bacterium]
MKKILALILALTLLFALAACGEGDKPTSPSDTNKPSTDNTTPDAGTTTPDAGTQEPAFSKDLTQFYTDMMNAAGEAPMMMDLAADKDMLEMYYAGLKNIETKQLVAVAPMMSAVAVEFVFVEVANASDVDAVKAILQARIDAQVAGGAWYPETIEQWKNNSEIVVIDNYVCLFVTSDKDILVDAFRNGTEIGEWAKAPIDLFSFLYDLTQHYGENFPANMAVSDDMDMLEMTYPGLKDIETVQLYAYQPMMGAVVCEIVLVEVANETDVEAVKTILQTRIDNQVAGGAWYPASIEGWQKDSRIVTNGNFIMMIAYSECDEVVSMFNDLF